MQNGLYGWWYRTNAFLGKVITLLLAALILCQVALLSQTAREAISRTDRLEGKSIVDSQLFIKKGEIEISIENSHTLKPLVFYLNGEKVPVPSGRAIKLVIKDGDVIEASGADFNDTAILKVTTVSDNIIVPELGKLVYVSGNLVMIDRVRLK